MKTISRQIMLDDNPKEAPLGVMLLCWSGGGWNFLRRRTNGEWENRAGQLKRTPQFWAAMPQMVP